MITTEQTVLVTGAGGYIGSVLVPKLLTKGYHVKAVDRFFFGIDKLQPHPNLEIIQDDARKLKPTLFNNVDFVIDLVAISNDPSGELFNEATWEINYLARARTAKLAKQAGVKRYILPSSCSIYGFQDHIIDETASTNPLTTYAKANEKAEQDVLKLSDQKFSVTILRQATVFGYSPRIRFDLAINGMTYGAWKNGNLPLMRDGKQYRPMVHVQDTTDVMCLLLTCPTEHINGQLFNVGGNNQNYQLGKLGKIVADTVSEKTGKPVEISWYGDPDHRSYQVCFDKIQKTLNWQPAYDAKRGASELVDYLTSGKLKKSKETITLDWYKALENHDIETKELTMYGGLLNLNTQEPETSHED